MPMVTEQKNAVDASSVYAMRYTGATLKQIADKIGKTKERVRQILIRNYGTTKHKLFSTRQLCKLTGLSRNRIMMLYESNIIAPVKMARTSIGCHFLWSPDTVQKTVTWHRPTQFCKLCHRPVPHDRKCFCSERCYKDNHKYKYMDTEAKQRHLQSIKKYREKRRKLVLTA
jgi:predicted nucleic acid-binding Zn ribbon protein